MSTEAIYDDLEYTSEGVFLLDGNPFTGLAYEVDDAGNRVFEIPFVDGREHGQAKDFFRNGALKREMTYQMGKKHGTAREWYDSYHLKMESDYEYGVLMECKEWSVDGAVQKEYVRHSSDYLYKLVVERRNERGGAGR